MSNLPTPNAESYDEELANFTDTLLEDKMNAAQTTSQDNTLKSLQSTVVRIHSAFGETSPPDDMARRIHANLQKEWQQSATRQPSAISRLMNSLSGNNGYQSRRRRQTYTLGITVAALAAFALVFVFALGGGSSGGGIEGAAQGTTLNLPVAILLPVVVVLGGLLWWVSRRKS